MEWMVWNPKSVMMSIVSVHDVMGWYGSGMVSWYGGIMTRLWWGVGVIRVTWPTTWPPRVNSNIFNSNSNIIFISVWISLNRKLNMNKFLVMKAIILNNNSGPYWELTCYFYQENLNHEENINHDVSSWLFVTTN